MATTVLFTMWQIRSQNCSFYPASWISTGLNSHQYTLARNMWKFVEPQPRCFSTGWKRFLTLLSGIFLFSLKETFYRRLTTPLEVSAWIASMPRLWLREINLLACWTNQYVPPHDLEGEKVSVLVKGTITPEGQRPKGLKIDKTASYAASLCTFTQCLKIVIQSLWTIYNSWFVEN